MSGWALSISGGGRNGAYSAGAIHALEVEAGLTYQAVAGTSVGALQSGPALLGQSELLKRLFRGGIRRKDVFRRWGYVLGYFRGGAYSAGPLRKLIDEHLDLQALEAVFPEQVMVVTAVCEETGVTVRRTNSPDQVDELPSFVLASAAMQIFVQPIKIGGLTYSDGGLTDVQPAHLLPKIAHPLDGVIAIDNYPERIKRLDCAPKRLVPRFARVMEIGLQAVARDDVELARVRATAGMVGKFVHVRPDRDLGSPMDFDPDEMRALWELGRADALRAWESAGQQ